MQYADLNEAIFEAERFIKRAKETKKEITQRLTKCNRLKDKEIIKYFSPNKIFSSCKRASMDLSRALSKMRRG